MPRSLPHRQILRIQAILFTRLFVSLILSLVFLFFTSSISIVLLVLCGDPAFHAASFFLRTSFVIWGSTTRAALNFLTF